MAAPSPPTSTDISRTEWMSQLPEKAQHIPLNQLCIPGSHNSCSATLDIDNPPSPACPELISNLCLLFGPGARQIMRNWSLCQSLTLTEQLEAGIRYFDLRITSKPGSPELFFEHSFYAGEVKDGISNVKAFIEKHPKEIVLLDFNHFTKVSESSHEGLVNLIKDTFGSKLCAISDVSSLTLAQLWESELQVFVFYHNEIVEENPELWPGELVPAPWAKTDKVDSLLSFIEKNTSDGLPEGTFHVTQGILTVSPEHMMANLGGSLKEAMAVNVAHRVTELLVQFKEKKTRINIITIDFVELEGFTDKVIGLNY